MTSLTHGRFDGEIGGAVQRRPAQLGLAQRVADIFHTWRRRIDEREALAAFSVRDMKDIGIGYSEVMHEITKPFWKA